jgi:hypothetical protein
MKQFLSVMISLFVAFSICEGQINEMRPLSELLENQKKGWDVITQWKFNAKNKVEILPKEDARADSALYRSQFFASSPIGAIVYGCGGILIEDGWIRILGSGCKQFDRSLPDWNKGKSSIKFNDQSTYLLIGDDIIGGIYAMKTASADNAEVGRIYYFGPNSLRWEATGLSYAGFINFCFSGDLENFYSDFRWSGWNEEIKKLNGNEVISCYPLLWTKEGKELKANRKIISVQKLWDFYHPNEGVGGKAIVSKNKTVKKTTRRPAKS